MTARPYSDATLDALASAPATVTTVTCGTCGCQAVPEYPHRHETPLRPDYNPMPPCPDDLDEMIAFMREGLREEIPIALHVSYVPGRAEPIAVSEYSQAAAGYVVAEATVDVLDTGSLGSPSWSPPFHHRIGGITGFDGDWTLEARDYALMPWTYATEVVLRNWCRSRHLTRPEEYAEHRGVTVCHDLTRELLLRRSSIDEAVAACGLSMDRAMYLLSHQGKRKMEGALHLVWRAVSERLNNIDLRRQVA